MIFSCKNYCSYRQKVRRPSWTGTTARQLHSFWCWGRFWRGSGVFPRSDVSFVSFLLVCGTKFEEANKRNCYDCHQVSWSEWSKQLESWRLRQQAKVMARSGERKEIRGCSKPSGRCSQLHRCWRPLRTTGARWATLRSHQQRTSIDFRVRQKELTEIVCYQDYFASRSE